MANINEPELCLVLTLYDEEECVEDAVCEITSEFDKRKIDYQLILVNNGSRDNTAKIIRKLEKKNRRIETMHVRDNLGFGGGILMGMQAANSRYIGFTCGDNQVSAEDTTRIFQKIKNGGFDLVKARRVIRYDGLFRILISRIFNLLVFFLITRGVDDVNSFPIIIKKAAFKKINPGCTNWLINLEILVKALNKNYKIGEVPIKFHKRAGGKSHINIFSLFEFFIDLMKFKHQVCNTLCTRG